MPRHPPYALSSLTIKKLFSANRHYLVLLGVDTSVFVPTYVHLSSYAIVKEREIVYELVEVNGFEPMASCVQGRRSPN